MKKNEFLELQGIIEIEWEDGQSLKGLHTNKCGDIFVMLHHAQKIGCYNLKGEVMHYIDLIPYGEIRSWKDIAV